MDASRGVSLSEGYSGAGMVTHRGEGLFPKPAEIQMDCSCPDWATMCKHVAAVMYGVGARLDQQPELLFTLGNVDHAGHRPCCQSQNLGAQDAGG